MKKTILVGLILATVTIGAVTIASLGTSSLAVEKNLAGQEASQLARCDTGCLGEPDTNKGAMGQHSSSQSEPRNGLANALTEHGDPQHPSEVINQLCNGGSSCP